MYLITCRLSPTRTRSRPIWPRHRGPTARTISGVAKYLGARKGPRQHPRDTLKGRRRRCVLRSPGRLGADQLGNDIRIAVNRLTLFVALCKWPHINRLSTRHPSKSRRHAARQIGIALRPRRTLEARWRLLANC